MKITNTIRIFIVTASIIIPVSTYLKSKLDHNKALLLKQAKNRVVPLGDAMQGFCSYMDMLIDHYKLPRHWQERELDRRDTWFALEYHATGSKNDDLVPFSKLLELKRAYKYMLQLRYPKYFEFAKPLPDTITRRMAKKRIKARVYALQDLDSVDQAQARKQWKRIKNNFVNPQLDVVTFADNNAELVMLKEDAQKVMAATKRYVQQMPSRDN